MWAHNVLKHFIQQKQTFRIYYSLFCNLFALLPAFHFLMHLRISSWWQIVSMNVSSIYCCSCAADFFFVIFFLFLSEFMTFQQVIKLYFKNSPWVRLRAAVRTLKDLKHSHVYCVQTKLDMFKFMCAYTFLCWQHKHINEHQYIERIFKIVFFFISDINIGIERERKIIDWNRLEAKQFETNMNHSFEDTHICPNAKPFFSNSIESWDHCKFLQVDDMPLKLFPFDDLVGDLDSGRIWRRVWKCRGKHCLANKAEWHH